MLESLFIKVFSVNIGKFLKNSFFNRTSPVATSKYDRWNFLLKYLTAVSR